MLVKGCFAAAVAAIGLGLAPGVSYAGDWGQAPPSGTSYWISNGGDLVVMKRNREKVRSANPLAPCFTGIRRPDGGYSGGGYNQNSGYSYGIEWYRFKGGYKAMKTATSDGWRSGWYYRSSRWEALNRANPSPPNIPMLFSDCTLK